jgi:hypothetical protein
MGHIGARESAAVAGATVLPFVARPPGRSVLGVRERIAALRWAEAVRPHGVRAVHLHEPEPGDDPALGSFLLIYCDGALWARWGVSCGGGRYEVWRSASGATIGRFATLDEALAVIQTAG